MPYLVFALENKTFNLPLHWVWIFKDSSAVYLDPLYFDLAVARSNKKKKKKKKMEIFGYFTKCRKL